MTTEPRARKVRDGQGSNRLSDMSGRRSKFQDAKKAILDAHGVSAAEWSVLEFVRLRVPLPPDELARYIVGYMEPFPESRLTEEEYRGAMDSLVEKDLLCVLGFADAVSPAPPHSTWDDDEIDWMEGKLDFTPTGFALMQQVSAHYEARFHRPLLRRKPTQ